MVSNGVLFTFSWFKPYESNGQAFIETKSEQRGYDLSGQTWAEISLPNGKKKSKRSKTQKVVKEWLLSQREAVRDGTIIENDQLTFGQFIDKYLSDVAALSLRPKTLEVYNYLIRMHIRPELGKLRLSQLRPDHLQTLYSQKLSSGLSNRTVQFMHSITIRPSSMQRNGAWWLGT